MLILDILAAQAAAIESAAYTEVCDRIRAGEQAGYGRTLSRHNALLAPLRDHIEDLRTAQARYQDAVVWFCLTHCPEDARLSWQADLGSRLRVERRWRAVMDALRTYMAWIADAERLVREGRVTAHVAPALAQADQIRDMVLGARPDPDILRTGAYVELPF